MTVKQLIEALQALENADDMEVQSEGCDCLGPVAAVDKDCDGEYVLLLRKKPEPEDDPYEKWT